MATGSWGWRGFRVNVTVPDRLVSRPGSRMGQGSLRFKPTPSANFVQRDPNRALEFLKETERRPQAASDAGLAERVAAMPWYHTLEFPGGVITPGRFDHRELVPHYGFPVDLTGKRALDVATFDGFWAFEMERRGAEVVAIDLGTTRDVDFPTRVRPLADSAGDLPQMGGGFALAKEALGSAVDRRVCSVYDLNPAEHGMFDLVHCGDLLVHLRDPLRALEAMRSVTSGELLLSDGIMLAESRGSAGRPMMYIGGWDDVVWWLPSLDALAQMAIDAGYRDVRVNSVYNLAKTYEDEGFWRASITAVV
ncbi:MAG TPA: methyltransferase domain-containing protein [Mycobacteriales bacterium]|nr:methyltransferase domain-containing protein [Mycobacteriales bacterium]